MAILVLAILLVIVIAAVAYPLLPGQALTAAAATVADRDVERAVRRLRAARAGAPAQLSGDLRCAACGHPYLVGDRFCVKCGADLPVVAAAPTAGDTIACPQCGVPLRAGDVFCSKCGHRVAAGEES